MKSAEISSSEGAEISQILKSGRTVLYEEMSEYYYLFARPGFEIDSNVVSEVEYHIGNLLLLSIYFDNIAKLDRIAVPSPS